MTEHPVRHLLRCMLAALREAAEDRKFHSEKERRRWLRDWLRDARKEETFRRLPDEITTLRRLLDNNRVVYIESVLNQLLINSEEADNCDLFRFRAALNAARKTGWRTGICRCNDEIFYETLSRAETSRRHILQLGRTEESFALTGEMTAPVTFHLIQPQNHAREIVEQIFHDEKFQVVTGREKMFNRSLVRTIWIGRLTLPDAVWGAVSRKIWTPAETGYALH